MVKGCLFIYLFIYLLTLFNVEKDIMVIYLTDQYRSPYSKDNVKLQKLRQAY